MSDSPATVVMDGPTPPGYGGDSAAVNTPAAVFSTRSHSHGQADPGYSMELEPLPCLLPSTHRHEQRAAESEQRVSDRWTRSTDGGVESRHAAQAGVARMSGALERPSACATQSDIQELKRTAGVAPGPSTSTGKADADYGSMGWRKTHEADAVPTRSDAAKPTPFTTYGRKSPFWRWT